MLAPVYVDVSNSNKYLNIERHLLESNGATPVVTTVLVLAYIDPTYNFVKI